MQDLEGLKDRNKRASRRATKFAARKKRELRAGYVPSRADRRAAESINSAESERGGWQG